MTVHGMPGMRGRRRIARGRRQGGCIDGLFLLGSSIDWFLGVGGEGGDDSDKRQASTCSNKLLCGWAQKGLSKVTLIREHVGEARG